MVEPSTESTPLKSKTNDSDKDEGKGNTEQKENSQNRKPKGKEKKSEEVKEGHLTGIALYRVFAVFV